MPIRIAGGWGFIRQADIATAIRWAATNGADIQSNSWGSWFALPGIYSAIADVTESGGIGRDGKGCVVLFSSGNWSSGGPVCYPAKYSEAVAVGATDANDVAWLYSGSGPELDIVAPSGACNLEGDIWTTDIAGPNGYNNRDSNILDYTDRMGGTSGACPIAAGAAALVLSVDPNLTSGQVQCVLQTSALDLGEGGRDDYYGYGRVDAYAAVALAGAVVSAYTLEITSTGGGTTVPADGVYTTCTSSVEVTALPADCYEFDHWEIDGNGVDSNNPYWVVMDGNHTLHAVFVEGIYDLLTITATSGGTTDPAPGTLCYAPNSVVEVNALSEECYAFDHWELDGNDVGSANPYSVFMDSNHTLDAFFSERCWPMFRHDRNNTGYSPSSAPDSNQIIWTYETGGAVFSSPAVFEGQVYVGSDDNDVYCLDASNGDLIWSYTTNGDVFSSPTVVDSRVYVGSWDGKVYCLPGWQGLLSASR
jgi:hypothetical protein